MATIKTQNNRRNAANDGWDVIHQETSAGIVLYSDGTNVESNYVRQPGYGTTTGSANTYVLTLSPAPTALVDGLAICAKINVQNTGASTINVNGLGAKSILDSKGNAMTAGKLKASTPYTMRYNGTNFILQGEGASGNATASDLLSGKTASVDAGDITGTMTNRGAVTITPGTTNQAIAAGYHNGSGYVAGDADLVAANILAGKNIFGVDGGYSNIKSIQSGVYTAASSLQTMTIPITTIDPTKSIVLISYSPKAGSTAGYSAISAKITTATELTLYSHSGVYTGQEISWQVIEFNGVKSLQKGNVTISNATESAISISSINLSKSIIICTNKSSYGPNSGVDDMGVQARLISPTSIGIKRFSTVPSAIVEWQVIEFS